MLGLVALGAACERTSTASSQAKGAELYAAVCARCHGHDGGGGLPVGTGQTPRNFRDASFHSERTDGDLRQVIIQGKPPGMPGFGTALRPLEIDALVTHVRSLKSGSSGSPSGR
jgi:mono/diheme cytochrome c family protein